MHFNYKYKKGLKHIGASSLPRKYTFDFGNWPQPRWDTETKTDTDTDTDTGRRISSTRVRVRVRFCARVPPKLWPIAKIKCIFARQRRSPCELNSHYFLLQFSLADYLYIFQKIIKFYSQFLLIFKYILNKIKIFYKYFNFFNIF